VAVEHAPTDAVRFGHKLTALTEVRALGIAVPPGFGIDAETAAFYRRGDDLPIAAVHEIKQAIAKIEAETGLRYGDPSAPLLLSVRPSAPTPLPSLLATVLNVGLTSATIGGLFDGLGKDARTRRFALDCRLSLMRTYGEATLPRVHSTQASAFSAATAEARRFAGATTTGQMGEKDLDALTELYEVLYRNAGAPLPSEDPWVQLFAALRAVSRSWDSLPAQAYRASHQISSTAGPALAVMAMAYGNADSRSASGSAMSRHPATGARGLAGELLPTALGDELAAGHGTPVPLSNEDASPEEAALTMQARMPDAYRLLGDEITRIERHLKTPVEVEFTVEQGKLWILQAQSARLGARAQVRATVDLATEGLISIADAVRRVRPAELATLIQSTMGAEAGPSALFARGLGASPGAVTGKLALSTDEVLTRAQRGEATVMVVIDTAPGDVNAIRAAKALVTTRGGTTSDAAITARALGKPCVVSARDLVIDLKTRQLRSGDQSLREGESITVDGARGEVLIGRRTTIAPRSIDETSKILAWADEAREIDVRAVAETAQEIAEARGLGAHGILAHKFGRWIKSELGALFEATGDRPLTLRLPPAQDPDMDAVRLSALVEAAKGKKNLRLEVVFDGLGWNLHPRLLKLRARLAEAAIGEAKAGVWIDTEADLVALLGTASPLPKIDVVIADLDALGRRSSIPGVNPPTPLMRLTSMVETTRVLPSPPTIGVLAALASDAPDLGPYARAGVAFVGTSNKTIALARLAAACV